MKSFDLVVIGGGPGGYVAAVRSAQLGFNVAVIDKRKSLGGTCLNVGCIPSKALLESSEHAHQAKHSFEKHGVQVSNVQVDIKQMMKRKDEVVTATTSGIEFLMKKNKITVFEGTGSFVDANTVLVSKGKTEEKIQGKHIIIATGSEVTPLPPVPVDGKQVITSDEAIALTSIPKKMIVIGGGVIGLELGSVYARIGTEVTVVEFLDSIVPTMDRELGKALKRSMQKLGVKFQLQTKVTGVKKTKTKVTLTAEDKSGKEVTFEGDKVLVAIGRRPYTDQLGLDKVGISQTKSGQVEINDHFQTSVPNIYAIGDVVRGPMLAHKASEEGVAVAEIIGGKPFHMDYNTVPGVVYTWPEVAAVGATEEQLKEQGIAYKSGKFPFKASGRARAAEETEGFVKVLADKDTDELLGVHMIGPRTSDLIGQAVIAMTYRASAEDLGMIISAHPTYSEALKEASLDAFNQLPIHL